MNQQKPITIKEIAKRLKISTSTVSRALNDHPSIGWATTTRVKRMAAELNYEPNQTAIFFKKGKTFTIGVVLPNLSEPFFSSAISEIENYASQRKYTVIMGQSLDDPEREARIVEKMREHRVDGLLMSVGKNTQDYNFVEILKKSGIPIVFFDCVPDLPSENIVMCDLKKGMIEAIGTFVTSGHRHIALVNGPEMLPATIQRKEAYIKGLQQYDIDFDEQYLVNTVLTQESNEAAIDELLNLAVRPSAIICFNDFVALDVMKYARNRGVVLNQDIHFISYANYPLWKYMENPPLASIEQFPDKQAKKATEILFELIAAKNTEPAEPVRVVLEARLVSH